MVVVSFVGERLGYGFGTLDIGSIAVITITTRYVSPLKRFKVEVKVSNCKSPRE